MCEPGNLAPLITFDMTQNKLSEGMGVVWTKAGTAWGREHDHVTHEHTPAASTWGLLWFMTFVVRECGSSWEGFTLLLERWWMILILKLSGGPRRSARQNHWEIWLDHMILTCCPECGVSLMDGVSRSCRGRNCCWLAPLEWIIRLVGGECTSVHTPCTRNGKLERQAWCEVRFIQAHDRRCVIEVWSCPWTSEQTLFPLFP